MKLTGYRSPGRRATRDKLRAIAYPTAVNCPPIFAEDREFMRLFWESKRIEGDRRQRDKFNRIITELRARGTQLMKQEESADA